MKKVLIIQTASIGDVVLATSLIESFHASDPHLRIDVLVNRRAQGLFERHPFIGKLWSWDKRTHKYRNLLALSWAIRDEHYDAVINVHRAWSSGWVTFFSGAMIRRGFLKNPLSIFYTKRFSHRISATGSMHEVERNHVLVSSLISTKPMPIRLYPTVEDVARVSVFKTRAYICIAPASLWYTKQYSESGWQALIAALGSDYVIYLLGSVPDQDLCSRLSLGSASVLNLCGKLSLLESAALMRDAQMNYVNDSAPLHLASAMDAPVTAIFCSTVPEFGFGPRSNRSHVVQVRDLPCRPCGIHGHRTCPKGHFRCANDISVKALLKPMGIQ